MSMTRRRMMMMQDNSAPTLNGLIDRNVSATDKVYSISNNQFNVSVLNNTSSFCPGQFKFSFEIKNGDVIFFKLTNVSGSIGSFQKVRLYNEDGSTLALTINDNVGFNALKNGIRVTVVNNATVGYISIAWRTGFQDLPAIFTPILKVNDVDMIN